MFQLRKTQARHEEIYCCAALDQVKYVSGKSEMMSAFSYCCSSWINQGDMHAKLFKNGKLLIQS